jgi:beta-glucosidase
MSGFVRILPFLAASGLCAAALALVTVADEAGPLYLDETKPVEARVEDLLGRLTLDEKVLLVHGDSTFTTAPIPRLSIPRRWLSDGPHGVREDVGPNDFRPGGRTDDFSTWLPVGIALAATWNPELAKEYGAVIGQEARARGKHIMLGPAVNILRTPLNGRNFEYFGEDPFLAARMVVPWIRGIQAEDVAACVKHYALNNQEWERMTIDVEADERALREIYLPPFEAAVKEGGVHAVMGAYNRFRGRYACHNEYLLDTILKGEWGFRGIVISDWNGTHDTREAIASGLDLEMGTDKPFDDYYLARPFRDLLEKGEVPVSALDDKVRRNLRVMLATKAFDERRPGSFNTKAHQDAARKIAEEAIVLLKNEGDLLPLDPARVTTVAVIGENAVRLHAHQGGSSEIKAFYEVTPLEGIVRRAGDEMNVVFSRGYRTRGEDARLLERAVSAARQADVAIVVGGLNHDEYGDGEGIDRKSLELPGGQAELIRKVAEVNPRTIVVLVAGSPVTMESWLSKVPSVVQAWYGGMEGGNALAAILFGDVNPSGKLPATFPRRLEDSPAHARGAYPGRNGTVRYEEGLLVGYRWFDTKAIEPLFPFGHGLSYTKFGYANLRLVEGSSPRGPMLTARIDVRNDGRKAGAETVQVYVEDVVSTLPRPRKELKAFAKVRLEPGEKKTIEIPLGADAFAFYDSAKKAWRAEAGSFRILVGSSSRDIRAEGTYVQGRDRTIAR